MITVVDTSCNPIPNAKVDIWHTNASGKYSGVNGNSEKFLRGSQVTNTQGKATFTSIFPGWYPGRVMHIHVKVWRNGQDVFTSQFFAKDSQVAQIYKSGAYANRGAQQTNMANDFEIEDRQDNFCERKVSYWLILNQYSEWTISLRPSIPNF